jgi:MFS family permease
MILWGRFELIYSFIASSFFMGVLMGNMVLAHCMDRFGRKGASTYIRSSLGMISAGMMILSYYLNRIELFAIAQFLAGVISAFKTVLFIYLAECAPDESRG